MSRFVTVTGLTLAVVFALTYAIPAAGGPQALSSADPVSLAKKALKKAKKADRTARQARTSANQALAKLGKKGAFLSGTIQTVTSPPLTIPPTASAIGASSSSSGQRRVRPQNNSIAASLPRENAREVLRFLSASSRYGRGQALE